MGKEGTATITTAPITPKALELVNCAEIDAFVSKLDTLTHEELRECVTDLAFALIGIRGRLTGHGIALELRGAEVRA